MMITGDEVIEKQRLLIEEMKTFFRLLREADNGGYHNVVSMYLNNPNFVEMFKEEER